MKAWTYGEIFFWKGGSVSSVREFSLRVIFGAGYLEWDELGSDILSVGRIEEWHFECGTNWGVTFWMWDELRSDIFNVWRIGEWHFECRTNRGVTFWTWDELRSDILNVGRIGEWHFECRTNWGVTFCMSDELESDTLYVGRIGEWHFVGAFRGVHLGQTWIWWKGGSYIIDVDSRVQCWTRGFIKVPNWGRGAIGVGPGEVEDVWQELLKL